MVAAQDLEARSAPASRADVPWRMDVGTEQLHAAGLRVPDSWRFTAANLDPLILAENGWYYCRTLQGSTKTTVVEQGRNLTEALGRLDESLVWLVQPLSDFALSGAAFIDGHGTYVELVHGSPIGLLRFGELALAVYSGETDWRRPSAQATQWRYFDRDLRPINVSHHLDLDGLIQVSTIIEKELRKSGLTGLVEFGVSDGEAVYLDYKASSSTGSLRDFVASLPEGPSQDGKPPVLELPEMTLNVTEGMATPLRFRRGARLSHFVTYRCRSGFPACDFIGW